MYVLKNTDAVPSTTFPVRNCFMSKEVRYLKTERLGTNPFRQKTRTRRSLLHIEVAVVK